MMPGFFILFGIVLFPAAFMCAAVRLGLCRTWKTTVPLLAVAACAMPAMIFLETQQADAITRAASFVVTPVLALFSLVPASLAASFSKRT